MKLNEFLALVPNGVERIQETAESCDLRVWNDSQCWFCNTVMLVLDYHKILKTQFLLYLKK